MEKMLVVVFDDESKAREGFKALARLDSSDDISVYAEAVVKKNNDGSLAVSELSDVFPVGEVTGTSFGALLDLMGYSLVPGSDTAAGALAGSIDDLDRAGVTIDFLIDVSGRLKPGRWAVVADISEEKIGPLDSAMKALGGTVFRVTRESMEDEQNKRAVAAMRNDEKALEKEEKEEEHEERKAELHEKIQALHDKMHSKLENAKLKSQQRKLEAEAKVNHLKQKMANANGRAKASLEARIHEQKEDAAPTQSSPVLEPQQQVQSSQA